MVGLLFVRPVLVVNHRADTGDAGSPKTPQRSGVVVGAFSASKNA